MSHTADDISSDIGCIRIVYAFCGRSTDYILHLNLFCQKVFCGAFFQKSDTASPRVPASPFSCNSNIVEFLGWRHPKISGSNALYDSTDFALQLSLFCQKVFCATFFQKSSENRVPASPHLPRPISPAILTFKDKIPTRWGWEFVIIGSLNKPPVLLGERQNRAGLQINRAS